MVEKMFQPFRITRYKAGGYVSNHDTLFLQWTYEKDGELVVMVELREPIRSHPCGCEG